MYFTCIIRSAKGSGHSEGWSLGGVDIYFFPLLKTKDSSFKWSEEKKSWRKEKAYGTCSKESSERTQLFKKDPLNDQFPYVVHWFSPGFPLSFLSCWYLFNWFLITDYTSYKLLFVRQWNQASLCGSEESMHLLIILGGSSWASCRERKMIWW